MRANLRCSLLLLLLSSASAPGWGEETGASVCLGIFPLQGKVRPLLVRAATPEDGPEFDQIRISIKETDSAGARVAHGPARWKLRKKRQQIHLVGQQATHGPVEFRLNFRRAVVPRHHEVDVQLLRRGRIVVDIRGHPFTTFPIRQLRSLLTFPPLLTPGETVGVQPLNPCLTPPTGRWTVGGVPLVKDPERPELLFASLSTDLNSLDPLPVTYVSGVRETLVKIENLFDDPGTRVAPSVDEKAPRLVACGGDVPQESPTCVCGWFPSLTKPSDWWVDGTPAPTPVAVSNRSICFDLEPGPHRIEPEPSAPFLQLSPLELQTIQVQVLKPPLLHRGRRDVWRWTVTGTTEPVKLHIRNLRPSIVHLEGGAAQELYTSGGTPNTASRQVHGLRRGAAKIQTLPLTTIAHGTEYGNLLRHALVRDLHRLRDDFLQQAEQIRARNQPAELFPLIDSLEEDLLAILRFRELAPLRDSIQTIFEKELRPQARTVSRAWAATPPPTTTPPSRHLAPLPPLPVLLGAVLLASVEGATAETVIKRVLRLFETLTQTTATLMRDLVVESDPAQLMVEVYPRAFPGDIRRTGTRGTLENLYLGKYEYKLHDPANHRIIDTGEIDLLHQTQRTLCLSHKFQVFLPDDAKEGCKKP